MTNVTHTLPPENYLWAASQHTIHPKGNIMDRKAHWEKVYSSKNSPELSWFQASPTTSLSFFKQFHLPKTARIIDVGGGDSLLVDELLKRGYENLAVLDISEKALERARQRLGEKASKVNWIVADATQFQPSEQFDCWHDRAAFHFLTEEAEIRRYVGNVSHLVKPNGYLVLGTFSENGPEKCSGLPVHRYSRKALTQRLKAFFKKIKCITTEHLTPVGKVQEFLFCSFQRLPATAY